MKKVIALSIITMFLASITSIDSFVLADRDSSDDVINWMKVCQMAPDFLVSDPCNELVNDDNELTSKGQRVLTCIGGGTLATLLGMPELLSLAPAVGCGGSGIGGLLSSILN